MSKWQMAARFSAIMTAVMLVGLGVVWAFTPGEPEPVKAGTIVGYRFSGDYPHRCRLWIKPLGSTLRDRVLTDPNTERECLDSKIGDRWTRWS
jgi:hypothetical protein